jgi:hypothetical protein
MKFWWKLIIIVMAMGILGISFIRASLEKVIEDDNQDDLRKIPISLEIENKQGLLEKICYKLPETRTLPDSPFYIIKNLRDELWIKFSNDPMDKAKIALLISDKKIEEAIILNQRGNKKDLILKTSQEAVEKLKLVNDLVSKMDDKDIETQKMEQKIETATLVYKKMIDSFNIGDKNQKGLFQIINTCNE